ncbi:MAG: rRNA maturation RNase YbeY [Eggerthellaceae bacterium]|nr:rRNA maturation RNase YbeY [Eggerthellaceae bacterium]
MDILISYDYREDDLKDLPLYELTQFVLVSEQKPFNTEVSVNFVTNESIQELNERYRNQKGPTDVLAFECDSVEDDLSDSLLSQNPIYELGDVIIAPDVADAQRMEYGTSFDEEIRLLLVHGLLHLCGYDHIVDEDAEKMEQRETDILKAWAERDID